MEKYLFQYCQKIVVFSQDFQTVLLAKRKGEADMDGVYSFIGGKMETTDKNTIESMKREKDEEVGENFKIKVCTSFNSLTTFKKKNGQHMVAAHFFAKYASGEITLNGEYSDYKWVPVSEFETFEPKVKDNVEVLKNVVRLKSVINETDFILI
jgi:hypothetical protein